jgi:hypothetical protein
MRKHDKHENLQRSLMPAGVQLLVKAGRRRWRNLNASYAWRRNSRKTSYHSSRLRESQFHRMFALRNILSQDHPSTKRAARLQNVINGRYPAGMGSVKGGVTA